MSKYHYIGYGVKPHLCPLCVGNTRLPKVCLWCWAKYKDREIDSMLENIDAKEECKEECANL